MNNGHYIPSRLQVEGAAREIVQIGRTPRNAAGFVSCDQVRAHLNQTIGCTVAGSAVIVTLATLFDKDVSNYYHVA
jgi:hypothetical protein